MLRWVDRHRGHSRLLTGIVLGNERQSAEPSQRNILLLRRLQQIFQFQGTVRCGKVENICKRKNLLKKSHFLWTAFEEYITIFFVICRSTLPRRNTPTDSTDSRRRARRKSASFRTGKNLKSRTRRSRRIRYSPSRAASFPVATWIARRTASFGSRWPVKPRRYHPLSILRRADVGTTHGRTSLERNNDVTDCWLFELLDKSGCIVDCVEQRTVKERFGNYY